jgi:hypothetical protein
MLPDQLTVNVSRLKRDVALDVGSAGNASSNNYLDPNNRADTCCACAKEP